MLAPNCEEIEGDKASGTMTSGMQRVEQRWQNDTHHARPVIIPVTRPPSGLVSSKISKISQCIVFDEFSQSHTTHMDRAGVGSASPGCMSYEVNTGKMKRNVATQRATGGCRML